MLSTLLIIFFCSCGCGEAKPWRDRWHCVFFCFWPNTSSKGVDALLEILVDSNHWAIRTTFLLLVATFKWMSWAFTKKRVDWVGLRFFMVKSWNIVYVQIIRGLFWVIGSLWARRSQKRALIPTGWFLHCLFVPLWFFLL